MIHEDLAPLFIFGCYRSGTSLLRLILNSHPKIFVPEETVFIPYIGANLEKYGCLAQRRNLMRLLQDILQILRKKSKWETVPDSQKILNFLTEDPDYAEVIRAVILAMAEGDISSLKYWGDKTPRYINSLQYLNFLYPNAKFINIVRDGRDVAASVKKEPFWGGRTPLMVAEEWNYRVLNGLLGELSLGPERFFTLQYEKLVSAPEDTLKDVVNFLDIEFDEKMLMFYKTSSAKKLTRFKRHKNVERPISTNSIARYKNMLTKKELEVFENEAGNTLLVLGYDVDIKYSRYMRVYHKLYDYVIRIFNGVMHFVAVKVKG